VADVDALLYLPGHDVEQLQAALDIPALSPGWRGSFQSMLENDAQARPAGIEVAPPPAWTGFRTLTVSDVVAESDSVTSFRFASDDALPAYRPGQFLTRVHQPAPLCTCQVYPAQAPIGRFAGSLPWSRVVLRMTEDTRTLSDLSSGIRFAMLTSKGPDGLRSRPVTVQKATDAGIWFLVADDADWLGEVDGQEVNVALVDDNTWVSVTATGQLIRDAAVLEDLGDPISDAWFEDGKQPVALQATMHHTDWWSAPGKLGQIVGLAKGVLGDGPPDMGDRGEIN
jgi:general stress protein 26